MGDNMIEHTDKQFERELSDLKSSLLKMGGLVEQMIGRAVSSLANRDTGISTAVVQDNEPEVNQLEIDIDSKCFDLLALRQPAATDLRLILTAIKISKDLERMGDMAVNIVMDAKRLNEFPVLKPYVDLPRMSLISQEMVRESLDAFVNKDTELANKVLAKDDEVDDYKRSIQKELVELMKQDSSTVERAILLIAIARQLERVGDLATNIAEQVVFLVEGKDIRHQGKL